MEHSQIPPRRPPPPRSARTAEVDHGLEFQRLKYQIEAISSKISSLHLSVLFLILLEIIKLVRQIPY